MGRNIRYCLWLAILLITVAVLIFKFEKDMQRKTRYFQESQDKIDAIIRSDSRFRLVRFSSWKGNIGVDGSVETMEDLKRLEGDLNDVGLNSAVVRVLVGRTTEERLKYGDKESQAGWK
jgi:hypothetical protein